MTVVQTPINGLQLCREKLFCKLDVDFHPLAPILLGEGSFILNEMPSRVYEQCALNLWWDVVSELSHGRVG